MLFIRFIATILMIIQSVNIYAQTREITLTDKTPPAIWIGTKAPTVITFPGDIGVCDETSRIINVSYGEAVKTNEGNWFKEILVNLDLTSIETNKDAINAERAEFGITCHYYVKGKRKGIELTLKVDSNNKKRVPFVLLSLPEESYADYFKANRIKKYVTLTYPDTANPENMKTKKKWKEGTRVLRYEDTKK